MILTRAWLEDVSSIGLAAQAYFRDGVKCLIQTHVEIKHCLKLSDAHVLDGVHEETDLGVELLFDANEIDAPVLARVGIDDWEIDVCVRAA